MSQQKEISNLIHAVLSDDYTTAKKQLSNIIEQKTIERIAAIDTQLEEGLFDRIAANTAGGVADIKAKAQNFGTKFGGGIKAAGQAVTGNFKGAATSLNKAQAVASKNDPVTASKAAKLNSIAASVENDLEQLFPGDPAIAKIAAALKELGARKATAKPAPKVTQKAAVRSTSKLPTKPVTSAKKQVAK